MADSKKLSFSTTTKSWAIAAKISWIGPWVSRIDWCEGHWCGSTYKYGHEAVQKQPKNTKNAFLACFRAYVGQPHNHPSHQSILLTQEPICEIFANFFWELAILKNSVFLSRPFWIFFFASSPWKSVTNFVIKWMGLNFDVFFGFQQIPCYA